MGRGSMRLPAITAKMNILRPTVQNGLQEIRNMKFKLHSTRQQLKKSVKTHTDQMNEVINKNKNNNNNNNYYLLSFLVVKSSQRFTVKI